MRQNNIHALLVAAFVLSIAGGDIVHAQSDGQSLVIEEILVTARKKVENLQEVPISINVISGAQVAAQRIASTEDLIARIPTFNVNSNSPTSITPALRGASSLNTTPGGDQSVGLFVDEIYYGGSSDWHPDLFDVERIEVLRGPQGTLFGRNVVGGALNVVTRDPGDEFEGRTLFGVGTDGYTEIAGYVSWPINDRWAAHLAASDKSRDGLLTSTYSGRLGNTGDRDKTDDLDKSSFRAKLRYAGDSTEWILGASYTKDNSSGPTRDYTGPPLPESILSAADAALYRFPDDDPNTTASPVEAERSAEFVTLSSKITWDTDFGEIISLTAYREVDSNETPVDVIGVPVFEQLDSNSIDNVEQFTQEFRINSNFGDNFDYTAGVYYLDQDASEAGCVCYTFHDGTFFGFIQNLFNRLTGGAMPPVPAGGTLYVDSNQSMNINTTSIAAYLQGTYRFNDAFSATLGVRWTEDEKTGSSTVTGTPNFIFGNYVDAPLDGSWSSTTPKFILDWKATDDVLLYASYAEGFKSGSFQYGDDAQLATAPFDPEEVQSIEIGAKTQLLNDRLQLNVSYYDATYDGQQNAFFDPVAGRVVIVNVGELEVKGLELDLVALLSEGLTVGLNFANTDSEVIDDPDFEGNQAALTPDSAMSLWVAYDVELDNGAGLTLGLDYQYKDDFYTEISNEAPFGTKIDGLVNAQIAYRMNDRITFSLWGKNLTDERYKLYSNDLGGFFFPAGDPRSAQVVMPRWSERRTAGISVTIDF